MDRIRNILGSFADSAVLFPLLVLMADRGLFPPAMLLLTAGAAYIAAGAYFRIPMPVQPLKSIVITAVAIGASAVEIRVSAALLGLACLLVVLFRADRWMELVPARLVHMVQVGLGVLLLVQGFRAAGGAGWGLTAVLAAGILLLPEWRGIPWMGLFAAGGMILALMEGTSAGGAVPAAGFDAAVVASLLLPQIALTFANSVLGTRAAARFYFPGSAERVTLRSLLCSIGVGNLLVAAVGGLPFCHGAGGLTAHVKGGARAWWANAVIGVFLILLGAFSAFRGITGVPLVFVATLLVVTGIQHFRLASETARR
ncbi:MAG: hypothetical protein HUU37_05315, partial [Bdellovibrionales bacterium]|nr:hypothetical protein [Bdellovibrionales bacterium]